MPFDTCTIKSSFDRAFNRWGIHLPDDDLELKSQGKIVRSGWAIWYLFGSDQAGEYLDYYASHRMTDDSHVRLYADGRQEELPTLGGFRLTSNDAERDAVLEADYFAENQRVAALLEAKGFDVAGDEPGGVVINRALRMGKPMDVTESDDGNDAAGMNDLARFTERVRHEWLLTYCHDDRRNYDPLGFRDASIKVGALDARDCMRAIDEGMVLDEGGGRFRAAQSSAREVLFWEGSRSKSPRAITLWIEPVITFAAIARLHFDYGWPKANLGTQPKGWAFDLAAYEPSMDDRPRILGEVKKSRAELIRLQDDFHKLSEGAPAAEVPRNSAKKWHAVLSMKPDLVWLIGPEAASYAYSTEFAADSCCLKPVDLSALIRAGA